MINIPDDSPLISFDEYGIDYNGPVPNVVIDNNVIVPDSEVKITEGQVRHLESYVNPPWIKTQYIFVRYGLPY